MSDAPDDSSARRAKRAQSRAEFEATVADIEAQVRATNARIEARTGRNLILAVLIALALGLVLLFSLIVVKDLFMLFAAFLLVFAALELATALRGAGRDVPRVAVVIAAIAIVPAAFYWHEQGQWLILLAGIVFVSLWRVVELLRPSHRSGAKNLLHDILAGLFIQVYVVFLGGFAVLLTGENGGQWWTLAFLIVVVSTDTGAYATGLAFGRHPMAPTISPKKTWEGFAGSLVVATIAGVLVALFMLHEEWWVGIVFGLAIAGTATVGDLTESLIKRDLGVKDMSTWLPGHGGFLDRLDSVLPSAAVAYALFLLFA